ncbi:NAD-dependent epimerase/dehydratase family protein [Glutamicibacter sp.]|uniref:NAD-dependent epimerase/dehydratase family protein n=1 Tax=Glutamicibacter sp. TaxID=1931995 RepID=UPI0028BEE55A|nr:NAD-dependent epimerase/dehydratase family protein [Glutamicibacter sp.]
MSVLITGTAGFIGFHTAKRFLEEGHKVVGYDGFTDYYDLTLKHKRVEILESYENFTSVVGMLENAHLLTETVETHKPEIVVHLAAQAGVRYSIENPSAYISSNVQGTFNLLEALRHNVPKHLLLASTSSVYGGNTVFPFEETARVGFPVSLYAATKSAGEAISHSYAGLFDIPTTCFRFFTVYGPWGRPDMALFKFVDRMLRGEEIEVYGNGAMSRDFTYIDDIVEGIVQLSRTVPVVGTGDSEVGELDSISPVAPWRVVNIAGGQPVPLMSFITAIENALGVEAKKTMLPMQAGDVTDTLASPELLEALTGFIPNTPLEEGISNFVDWYQEYHDDRN